MPAEEDTKVRPGAQHLYTLQEGDEWKIFNDYLVIANPARPPFMIKLSTGERFELNAQTE